MSPGALADHLVMRSCGASLIAVVQYIMFTPALSSFCFLDSNPSLFSLSVFEISRSIRRICLLDYPRYTFTESTELTDVSNTAAYTLGYCSLVSDIENMTQAF